MAFAYSTNPDNDDREILIHQIKKNVTARLKIQLLELLSTAVFTGQTATVDAEKLCSIMHQYICSGTDV